MEKFRELQQRFEKNSDPEKAEQMASYMRDQFEFYGLSASLRREQYKTILISEEKNGRIDWEFLDICWNHPKREMQYFVFDYLSRLNKYLEYEDIQRIRPYLETRQWWDTIDPLSKILGKIPDSRIAPLMERWSMDQDIWIRRVAILHQLEKKDRTDPDLLGRILIRNLGQTDFFINKAIGWSLRGYSKTDPEWVRGFIEKHKDRLNSLSIREGSKYI